MRFVTIGIIAALFAFANCAEAAANEVEAVECNVFINSEQE